VNCIELENFTFSDARVKAKLENYTLLQVDVTKNSAEAVNSSRICAFAIQCSKGLNTNFPRNIIAITATMMVMATMV